MYSVDGMLLRQVNKAYQAHFEALYSSGLYEELTEAGLLVRHENMPLDRRHSEEACAVIRPEPIDFISYPYEWCFGQLKTAALATLQIHKRALARGMSLKDASAYNIQFQRGKPLLIDTLSFEIYQEGRPWGAYGQFCQHFLAPLALMSKVDPRLGRLSCEHLDGIPLDLAVAILGKRARMNLGIGLHLRGHARSRERTSGDDSGPSGPKVSKVGMLGLLQNLEKTIRGFELKPAKTAWSHYYDSTNYSAAAAASKAAIVQRFTQVLRPSTKLLWDLGANEGAYSRYPARAGILTIASDQDPIAVEKGWRKLADEPEPMLLPLILDLANPSPAIGWANKERRSFFDRGPADAVMALALIHHLAIGNNVPFEQSANFLSGLGTWLVIEFVPRQDSQVLRLLSTRDDVFGWYTQEGFEKAFLDQFELVERAPVEDSQRTLYLLRRKKPG